jgi:hypothetical protein
MLDGKRKEGMPAECCMISSQISSRIGVHKQVANSSGIHMMYVFMNKPFIASTKKSLLPVKGKRPLSSVCDEYNDGGKGLAFNVQLYQ